MNEHEPVLLGEALEGLAVRDEGTYLDATLGRGGHTAGIVERLGENGRVLAVDRDPAAIAAGQQRFSGDPRVLVVKGDFSELGSIARERGFHTGFDGILLDLGVSSPQLDDPSRGFSFLRDGPLDMRMDPDTGPSAAEWLARATQSEIARVLREFGEERFARRIARRIVEEREVAAIQTTGRLATIVAAAVPTREAGKHPATRTFQALRMAVNDELGALDSALPQTLELLRPGARLCVISFHSLEDRRVKRFIRAASQVPEPWRGLPNIPPEAQPSLKPVGKAIRPTAEETGRNPRARSAVLRVAERLGP